MNNYFAFLLRIWSINTSETTVWVASLENPQTRKITTFKSLAALNEYLQDLTTGQPASETTNPPKPETILRNKS